MSILPKFIGSRLGQATKPENYEYPAKKILHLHIPKAAGTSFNNFFYRIYRRERVQIAGQMELDKNISINNYDFIAAHLNYSEITSLTSDNYLLVTFLRNPLDRALSQYYFLKKDSVLDTVLNFKEIQSPEKFLWSTEAIQEAKSKNTRDFFFSDSKYINSYFSNIQTKMICGVSNFTHADQGHLELAKNHLQKFFYVGVMEKMEESQREFCRLLNLPFMTWEKANANDARKKTKDEAGEITERVRSLNDLDFQLYNYALQLFEQQKTRAPINLVPVPSADNFTFENPTIGEGWHFPEQANGQWFAWNSSLEAWLQLKTNISTKALITCHIANLIHPSVIDGLILMVNDNKVPYTVIRLKERVALRGHIPAEVMKKAEGKVIVKFVTRVSFAPNQLDPKRTDTRNLGFAMLSMKIEKASIFS